MGILQGGLFSLLTLPPLFFYMAYESNIKRGESRGDFKEMIQGKHAAIAAPGPVRGKVLARF
jgi:hypothetical protein